MTSANLGRSLVIAALLAYPVKSSAQEAAINGTVTDSTGGVLPGVTVTAVHEASGNRFTAVLNDRTVLRGGAGKYYTDIIASAWTHSTRANTTVFLAVDNDGRPDFAVNPFNGPAPNYQQALRRVCDVNRAVFDSWRARNFAGAAPCLFRDFEELAPPPELAALTNSWQRVRSRELRIVRHGPKQPEVWTAEREHESRLRAAHAAARLPAHLLRLSKKGIAT